jgi:hypothetical protein
MRKIRLGVLGLAAALLLSGCGLFSERSYSSVTTHVEQRVSEDDPSVLRAETYQELVSAILCFVTEGTETGTVRLYQYTGDVESDLNAACKEILEEELLGVYALTDITHDYTRIVSYYECTFQLTFQHTADEIAAVSSAATTVSLREQIQQGMDRFASSLAFRTTLRTTEEQIKDMVGDYYDQSPQLALGRPEVEVEYYQGASDSSQRIIEVRFQYPLSVGMAQVQSDYVRSTVGQLAEVESTRTGLWAAFQLLIGDREITKFGSDSVYEYLYRMSGSEEAAVMAAELLCQEMGIDCQLVRGTDEWGSEHLWLAVCVEGNWCHLCPWMDNTMENFLRSDEEMSQAYLWEGAPECPGYLLEEEEEPELTEEENADEPTSQKIFQ